MLGEKKVEQSSRIVKEFIQDGKIIKPKGGTDNFFMQKSREALNIAKRLLEIYDEEGLETNLWVINTSYYSMFFAATALLAKFNHKIDVDFGIPKLTYHALVHYFIKEDNKLKKQFIEEHRDAVDDAEEILQLSEKKIKNLVLDLGFEINKRKMFTYEIGKIAERKKAETSYSRAANFFVEIEKIMS